MTKNEHMEELITKLYPNLKGVDKDKFLHVIKQTGLDPLMKQIYIVPRQSKNKSGNWVTSFTIQTSIDGFRLIAERSENYAPGREPIWEFDDNKKMISATAFVKKMTKDGTWHEIGATAHYDEYVQLNKNGAPSSFWKTKAKLMTAKCAEALALRKAFPDALTGVYTDDEMEQANNKAKEIDENVESEKKEALKLTKKQVKELDNILNKLPEYKKTINDFLGKKGILSNEDIPIETFDKILKKAQELLEIENENN